jgi:molybdenum cofactor cytidylyltransferase
MISGMQFDRLRVSAARGAILAHSVRAGERLLRKGHVLSAMDIDSLATAGVNDVMVARLGAEDMGEDEAAARIARALAGRGVRAGAAFTGRANLYAEAHGLLRLDPETVNRINAVDEAITLATLSPFGRVQPRQMLATVKIIPFAAPKAAVAAIEGVIGTHANVEISEFVAKSVALVSTVLTGTKPQMLEKNFSAVSARLAALGSRLVLERRVPHEDGAVASAIEEALAAGADPILIFGASAITDRRDVIPSAILRAGGRIERFGMPVDPGNLLLLGHVRDTTVIGLPGCARSPKRNGFDFVLERTLAEVPIAYADIAAMGVGGLLAEISARPQPRDARPAGAPRAPDVAAIVLAAGQSSRMGRNKLTAELGGKPLVRHAVEAAVASHVTRVIVVTGNEASAVGAALSDFAVTLVHNPDFRAGLSTSLKAGIRAVPEQCDAAVVVLGDMPAISAATIDKLIAAFNPEEGRAICVASHDGKRGNPVLWPRRFFPEVLALEGDVGAKHLIASNEELVCDVEAGTDAPLVDIDTPEAMRAFEARLL